MEVNELVEWVADEILLSGKVTVVDYESCMSLAKQILSHPDLALIDEEQSIPEERKPSYSPDIDKGQLSLIHNGWKKVIPLAEAIKEME